MTFAERLKDLRTAREMTQQDLADRCGITKAVVSMWESGKRMPSRENLRTLADIFNVQIEYLLGESPVTMRFLSSKELAIIDRYRHMDDSQRALIDKMFGL